MSDVSLKLFDNGHYSQATFEALKLLDQKVHTWRRKAVSKRAGMRASLPIADDRWPSHWPQWQLLAATNNMNSLGSRKNHPNLMTS
jgi:hypothetical protein